MHRDDAPERMQQRHQRHQSNGSIYNGNLLNNRDAGRKEITLSLERRSISRMSTSSSSGQYRATDIPKARNVWVGPGDVMHGFRDPNVAYLVSVVVSTMQLYAGTP